MIRQINRNELSKVKDFIFQNFGWSLSDTPFLNILIDEEDEIKSFLVYSKIYERIEIEYLGTLKQYRCQSLATNLLKYLLENEKPKEGITLEVAVTNLEAINLYKKFDFQIVTTRKNYYQNTDAYLMMRK